MDLIRDGYGTLDISKIAVHEEEIPKGSQIKGYRCTNCGCRYLVVYDGKYEEDFTCSVCKGKLIQTGGFDNEL